MAMARSESLESKCVGPADATMTQTLSRIMKMDDEEFTEKYVTMKAVLRYGVVSSAILAVTEEIDGEGYVQFPVDVDQFVAIVLTLPELVTEAMDEAMQKTTSDKVADFEFRLKAKGLLLADASFEVQPPTTPPPTDTGNETELQKKTAQANRIEQEIEALKSDVVASRKKSGLRLDEDLIEMLKEFRLSRRWRFRPVAQISRHINRGAQGTLAE